MKNYKLPVRNTLVIEMHTNTPVGTCEKGEKRIKEYMINLSALLGLAPLGEPAAHLSPKYGLSGWIPLSDGAAAHVYAWDDRMPSFISVDISALSKQDEDRVISHAVDFFGVDDENRVVFKSVDTNMTAPEEMNGNWRELDSTIFRKRLSISGRTILDIDPEKAGAYLAGLCEEINMNGLNKPLVIDNTAWMHWETSGTVMSWEDGIINLDIYTCKPFNSDDALKFTSKTLELVYMKHVIF